jgi:hypothetical protein
MTNQTKNNLRFSLFVLTILFLFYLPVFLPDFYALIFPSYKADLFSAPWFLGILSGIFLLRTGDFDGLFDEITTLPCLLLTLFALTEGCLRLWICREWDIPMPLTFFVAQWKLLPNPGQNSLTNWLLWPGGNLSMYFWGILLPPAIDRLFHRSKLWCGRKKRSVLRGILLIVLILAADALTLLFFSVPAAIQIPLPAEHSYHLSLCEQSFWQIPFITAAALLILKKQRIHPLLAAGGFLLSLAAWIPWEFFGIFRTLYDYIYISGFDKWFSKLLSLPNFRIMSYTPDGFVLHLGLLFAVTIRSFQKQGGQ